MKIEEFIEKYLNEKNTIIDISAFKKNNHKRS